MGILEDVIGFITGGSISGIPTIVWMILPLIIGVVVGYLLHKFLKIAVIIGVIVAIAAYLGFFGLSTSGMASLAEQYGPMVIQYGTLLIGILPLGIGFIIGFAVGFLLAK
ncbi:MAG: hypothetical protein ACQCN4_04410 [Candidatus Bathyarchaeia archaeon]|jgi:uncharacterized membrane protein (Fun14 family)